MKTNKEYGKFADLTDELLRVSHNEVKAKLDAEKKAKKRKKPRKYSASREANEKD